MNAASTRRPRAARARLIVRVAGTSVEPAPTPCMRSVSLPGMTLRAELRPCGANAPAGSLKTLRCSDAPAAQQGDLDPAGRLERAGDPQRARGAARHPLHLG